MVHSDNVAVTSDRANTEAMLGTAANEVVAAQCTVMLPWQVNGLQLGYDHAELR